MKKKTADESFIQKNKWNIVTKLYLLTFLLFNNLWYFSLNKLISPGMSSNLVIIFSPTHHAKLKKKLKKRFFSIIAQNLILRFNYFLSVNYVGTKNIVKF